MNICNGLECWSMAGLQAQSKASLPSKHLKGASFRQALALQALYQVGMAKHETFLLTMKISKIRHNLRIYILSWSVCLCKPFQSSRMLVSKTGAYPSEAPFRCSTIEQAPGLTCKRQTLLERFARHKQTSIKQKFIIYCREKFYNISTWAQCYKKLRS